MNTYVPHFMLVHQVGVVIFQRISEISDLSVALKEKSEDHISQLDPSSGYHDYLDHNSWQSIQQLSRYFTKTKNVSLTMLLDSICSHINETVSQLNSTKQNLSANKSTLQGFFHPRRTGFCGVLNGPTH